MREYSAKVAEALTLGLRSDERLGPNTMLATQLLGMKPKEYGLVRAEAIPNPFSGLTIDFPFPQLFIGHQVVLLAAETMIYEVDTSDWSYSPIITYNAYSPEDIHAIPAGGAWQFVDFYGCWFLYNGSCVVYKSNAAGMLGGANKALVQDLMTVRAGCEHRGRQVIGGFETSDYGSGDWELFWQSLAYTKDTGLEFDPRLGSNFILWSHIGGGDLTWLYEYARGIHGPLLDSARYNETYAFITEMLQRQDMGFMPMPVNGTVHAIKGLGNGLVVYMDNGIVELSQVSAPAPGFGLRRVHQGIGIKSRGAVGGDDVQHVFIGADDYLYQVSSEGLQRLGYKEFMSDLSDSTALVAFDSAEREFYIGDGTTSYVYTSRGLGQTHQKVTSVGFYNGRKCVGEDDADTFEYTSEEFDFGLRGLKTITFVRIHYTDIISLQACVKYRMERDDAWSQTSWVDVNAEGVVYLGITAPDFQLKFKGTFSSLAGRIDYVEIRYQVGDNRYVRGLTDVNQADK